MTTRPRLATDINVVNGLAAVALFVVMGYVFLTESFPRPDGFGDGSITASIGYAMFDMLGQIPAGHGETEGFLVAFILIAVVLDAALDAAVLLARREEDDGVVTALTDGGRLVGGDADAESASTDGDAESTSTDGDAESTSTDGDAESVSTDGGDA